MQTPSSRRISCRTSKIIGFEWDSLHGRKTRKWHDYLPEQYLLLSVDKKVTVCVFSPGTNSERDRRSHPETPLLRWPCNELSLCGAGLPRGSVEDIPSLQDQLPGPTQSTEPHGLMICAGFGMSGCNFRPQMFLAPRSLGGTVSLILRGEILWGPACNLRHIRQFPGQSAFAAN